MSARQCRTWWLGMAIIAALFVPGQAAAQGGAETMLQDAIVNYRVGKFADAIKILKKARRKTKDKKVLAKIHLYLGMTYGVKKKKQRKAKRHFKKALKLDCTVVLAAGDAKKSIVELFNGVREKMKGTLEITSSPAGARVMLDGKEVGVTPFDKKIHVGKRQVVLESKDGLDRFEAEVVVEQGESYAIQGTLKFVGGTLSVVTKPAGAKVLVDGKELGQTPQKGLRLVAGEHKLRLELEGYEAQDRDFKLTRGASVNLELTLVKPKPAAPPVVATPVAPPANQPVVPTTTTEQPAATDGGRSWPVWTMITGGLALAAVGAGVGLAVASDSAYDEYKTTKDPVRYDELADQVPALETGTNVAFAVGGALAVTAAVLYFLVDRPAMKASAEQRASINWTGSGAVLSWEF